MRCPACQADNPENSRFCGNCAAPLQPLEQKPPELTKTMPPLIDTMARGNIFASRYEIIEELGRGGMGRVYKVYDQKIKEVVALKLINPEYAAREKTIERFRDELRLARKIIHKNVCRMYDLSEEEGTSFITMEYVLGEDLRSMIRMMGALSPGQAVNIGKQICEGLGEAHRLGIIHRDLKPKNIIVDREGNARIMDFGIARSADEKGLTGERAAVGTPQYMSPEQVKGEKVDSRSDLYSLGIILYEMVTGRVPFDGETPLSIAVKHKTEPPPDPRRINAQIPEALVRVIFKCLEKDRQKRYQSTEEVLAALKEIEKDITSTRQILIKEKPSATRTKEMTIRLPSRRIVIPALIVLAVVVAAIFIWLRISQKEELPIVPATSIKPTLAVLYFKNDTGDQTLDYLRSTISDLLIADLQRSSKYITVLSADVILNILSKLNLDLAKSYTSEDLNKVIARGGASHTLLGIFSKAGETLRIIYYLKEASTELTIGSDRAEGHWERDLYRIVDDLSGKILTNFKLPSPSIQAVAPSSSLLAAKYYNLGRHAEMKYSISRDERDFQAALEWFNKAIQEDPGFALPHWGLGDAYEHRYSSENNEEDLELMLRHYYAAYSLDKNLAGANVGVGWALFYKKDNDQAYLFFKRAYELGPDDDYINFNIGAFLASVGLHEKAIKYFSKAISLGDNSVRTHRHRAICYEILGRYEDAEADVRTAVRIEPEDLRTQLYLVRLLIAMRKITEAEKEIAIAEKLRLGHEDIQYTRALLYAVKGEKEKALFLIKGIEGDVRYSYPLSKIYGVLGLREKAIEAIRQGIEKGFEIVKDYLYPYPVLANTKNYFYDGLRDDPRFKEILRNAEKTYYERLRKYNQL